MILSDLMLLQIRKFEPVQDVLCFFYNIKSMGKRVQQNIKDIY